MKVNVMWSWEGIDANTPFKLIGTSDEQALVFDSGLLQAPAHPRASRLVTATNDIGGDVRTIYAEIDWKMVLNPGAANEKTLSMGTSGAHMIHVLFGTPASQDREPFQATDKRMTYTVPVAKQALANARAAVAPAGPTYQRIAYHVVQAPPFHAAQSIVSAPLYRPAHGAQMIPRGDKKLAGAWQVPDTWTQPIPGADCISNAAFSWLVLATSGMPGEHSAEAYVPESTNGAGRTTAVPVIDATTRVHNGVPQVLQLVTPQGAPNYFEGTVIYTPPPTEQYPTPSTFYFPIDAPVAFTNKDHVLTVFDRLAWFLKDTKPLIEADLVIAYTRAPAANID